MWPIVTYVTCNVNCLWVSVCWAHQWALQKRLNRSRFRLRCLLQWFGLSSKFFDHVLWLFLLPTLMTVAGVGFSVAFVCLFICTISQKPIPLRLPNLTYKCSTVCPGNPAAMPQCTSQASNTGFSLSHVQQTADFSVRVFFHSQPAA